MILLIFCLELGYLLNDAQSYSYLSKYREAFEKKLFLYEILLKMIELKENPTMHMQEVADYYGSFSRNNMLFGSKDISAMNSLRIVHANLCHILLPQYLQIHQHEKHKFKFDSKNPEFVGSVFTTRCVIQAERTQFRINLAIQTLKQKFSKINGLHLIGQLEPTGEIFEPLDMVESSAKNIKAGYWPDLRKLRGKSECREYVCYWKDEKKILNRDQMHHLTAVNEYYKYLRTNSGLLKIREMSRYIERLEECRKSLGMNTSPRDPLKYLCEKALLKFFKIKSNVEVKMKVTELDILTVSCSFEDDEIKTKNAYYIRVVKNRPFLFLIEYGAEFYKNVIVEDDSMVVSGKDVKLMELVVLRNGEVSFGIVPTYFPINNNNNTKASSPNTLDRDNYKTTNSKDETLNRRNILIGDGTLDFKSTTNKEEAFEIVQNKTEIPTSKPIKNVTLGSPSASTSVSPNTSAKAKKGNSKAKRRGKFDNKDTR